MHKCLTTLSRLDILLGWHAKLGGLKKGRMVDYNQPLISPEFRTGDARMTIMPRVKNKMEITEERRGRSRRRPLSGAPTPSVSLT